MKRFYAFLGIACIAMLSLGLTGCYKDVIMPETDPDGPPLPVSFKLDVAPILEAKCTNAGCHNVGAHKPYLMKDQSYQNIVNGGFVNILVPKSSRFYVMLYGEMSEYMPSPKDKQKVFDWIRNGAPNN